MNEAPFPWSLIKLSEERINWVFEFVILYTSSKVIFSASGSHSSNTRDTKNKFGPGFTLVAELMDAAGIRGHFHEYSDGFEYPKIPC